MGKVAITTNVDLKTSTISGSLQQVKRSNIRSSFSQEPTFAEAWVCIIPPTQTKSILKFIKDHIDQRDLSDYNHIKRFRKAEHGNKVYIEAVLCASNLFTFPEIFDMLQTFFVADFEEEFLCTRLIPSEVPLTKELAIEWSSSYWPLSWKGNPNHQHLLAAQFDIEEEEDIIELLLSQARDTKTAFPVCTIIAEKSADSGKLQILHVVTDERELHPLSHSIMKAIANVASDELKRRLTPSGDSGAYLCQNLLVYTTHEPCTMCAMALVHSRIQQLIYVWDHPAGAIMSSHFIGDRRDLNWTFDIWKWVGKKSVDFIECPREVPP